MDYKKTIKESNLIRIHIPLNTTISLRNLQGDYVHEKYDTFDDPSKVIIQSEIIYSENY